MADLAITNAIILTADALGTRLEGGTMLIENGRIAAIGTDAEFGDAAENATSVINARGMLVMPGLINTHCHIASTLFRGLVEDLPLEPWLQRIWKAEAAILDPKTTHLGSVLGLVEMALGGVTTVMDMFWHPHDTVRAAREVGLRISTGGIVFDAPGVTGHTVDQRFEYADRFFQDFKDAADVIPAIMPHGAYTVSPDNLKHARALADRHGGLFCTHAAETRFEVDDITSRYGRSVIRHLDHLGLLDERAVLAHCVHLDSEEIEILARTAAKPSHNPVSNLKLASGIAPVPEMLEAGITVSLGTDGAVSGNDLDLWLAMRLAAMLHKGVRGDARLVSTQQALAMATLAGAETLGVSDRIGSLEVGKEADFIMIDLERAHAVPLFDPLTHAVFSTNKSDVRHVFVGGKQIVRDRELTGIVLSDVIAEVRELAPRIQASIA